MDYKVFDHMPSRDSEPICKISGNDPEDAVSQNLIKIVCEIHSCERDHITELFKPLFSHYNEVLLGDVLSVSITASFNNGNETIKCYVV